MSDFNILPAEFKRKERRVRTPNLAAALAPAAAVLLAAAPAGAAPTVSVTFQQRAWIDLTGGADVADVPVTVRLTGTDLNADGAITGSTLADAPPAPSENEVSSLSVSWPGGGSSVPAFVLTQANPYAVVYTLGAPGLSGDEPGLLTIGYTADRLAYIAGSVALGRCLVDSFLCGLLAPPDGSGFIFSVGPLEVVPTPAALGLLGVGLLGLAILRRAAPRAA